MGIFNNNLEIDIENPFKNDKLQREVEVKSLTAMFDIIDNQMVLAVNSQWGTGKTSFLKMWNQYLIKEGYKTIFFNAWENDYVEDPFIAFVDEIRESINDESKVRGFIEKAKDVGVAFVKQTPKMASKMIKEKTGFDTEGVISNDELSQMVSDKIGNYNKNKKSVDKFKKELEKIADKEFEESQKPMIIFVDELDRCRPDYAISLLERIKHFFNVQNIIFVMGIDKEALSNSIRVIYGEQTDINGYLTRFIDLEYKLKDGSREVYVEYLLEKYQFNELFINRKVNSNVTPSEHRLESFTEVVVDVVEGLKLSLRDIEKLVVELYMILKANIKNYIYPYPLILMCVIKRVNRVLYNQIKSNEIVYSKFLQVLKENNPDISKWIESFDATIFKAYLVWLLNDINEVNKIKGNADKVEDQSVRYRDKDVRFVELYQWIVNKNGYWYFSPDDNVIKESVFKMVQLYDNFNIINGD
jgi:hypothetical protein